MIETDILLDDVTFAEATLEKGDLSNADIVFSLSLVFGKTVGYIFVFIPLYIFCRILFKYLRPFLPYCKGVQHALDRHAETGSSEMP